MNILHLSSSDGGGAGRAAYRLHKGLQHHGVNSQMLVQSNYNEDRSVFYPKTSLGKLSTKFKLSEYIDAFPLQLYPQRQQVNFSLEWFPDRIIHKVREFQPNLINLHWICHGYIQIETLAKFNQPLVWTLHDMWPFTGGCHYTQGCERYQNSCGTCPQLNSSKKQDLSLSVWQRKSKSWQNLNLTIVTPSVWLANCANASSLFKDFRVEVIANGLDIQKYKPVPRQVARLLLNLPQDKQLILFGAMYPTGDPRKGLHLLQGALQLLRQSKWQDLIELAIFGVSEPDKPTNLGFKTNYIGKLHDDISLALLYAAADVFVAPSLQDNLPNTVMESLACGTPCVAFKIGGMPDMIEHYRNGYLAQPYQIEDLAQGITWVLEDQQRHQKLCDRARQKVEQEFTIEQQAKSYQFLYNELIAATF
jgi:glycosyltransferase involved in cell wall biosynthesis